MTQLLTEKQLANGVQIIRAGGTVAFRTETVFGLGANAGCDTAVGKVFTAKNRPSGQALAVQFASVRALRQFFPNVDPQILRVLRRVKSGITVVLPKESLTGAKGKISPLAFGGGETLGIRIPSDKFSRRFLRACAVPLVMPSANTTGQPPPKTWEDAYNDLNKRIDALFMNKPCKLGVQSTVLQIKDAQIKIIRPGAVSPKTLARRTGLEVT